jgi:hypothetical protein
LGGSVSRGDEAEEGGEVRADAIVEIGVDGRDRIFVKLTNHTFNHIYRAAMEVVWNFSLARLQSPLPRDRSPFDEPTHFWWYQQIVAAAADEYGVSLTITCETIWTNVPRALRAQIEGTNSGLQKRRRAQI